MTIFLIMKTLFKCILLFMGIHNLFESIKAKEEERYSEAICNALISMAFILILGIY